MNEYFMRTDFLVPTSGYVVGAGSIFNLSGNYFDYRTSDNPAEADRLAINSDWQNIGQDILKAILAEEQIESLHG